MRSFNAWVTLNKLLYQILGGSDNVLFIQRAIVDAASWSGGVDQVEAVFEPVNILVNNAGINYSDSIEDFPFDAYECVIATATKEKVSNLVLLLAFDELSYMTGSEKRIYGGLSAC